MTTITGTLSGPTNSATALQTSPEYPALVSDLFSTIDTGVEDLGQANAENALASGDTEEAGAYGSAQAIANANSNIALAAGQVEQAQTGLQVRQTIGTEQADVAGGGFSGSSGTALALMRTSTRQGVLQQQIQGVNADLQSGGYQEQSAAAVAEEDAAQASASEATQLAQTEQAIGQASKTNAVNEAQALGINIPGLSSLSATNVPTIPTTATTPTTFNNKPQQVGYLWGI